MTSNDAAVAFVQASMVLNGLTCETVASDHCHLKAAGMTIRVSCRDEEGTDPRFGFWTDRKFDWFAMVVRWRNNKVRCYLLPRSVASRDDNFHHIDRIKGEVIRCPIGKLENLARFEDNFRLTVRK